MYETLVEMLIYDVHRYMQNAYIYALLDTALSSPLMHCVFLLCRSICIIR